jgi:glycosyltransferase involved in cell wall biosynthesis
MKLLVLDNYGSFSLFPYLKERLQSKHQIFKMDNIYNEQKWQAFQSINPDVVFVDFCDHNAIILTQKVAGLETPPRIIVRLHGYEAQDSKLLNGVKWDKIAALVVVSPKFKEIVESKVTGVNVRVVYNGIDLHKFQPQDEADMEDNTIAYVGYLNKKKGLTLLRTIMASMPDKTFHVGGIHQDAHVRLYCDDLKLNNVTYHGWVKTQEFLKGKRFIISTSVTESFGMSIAEGMTMGLTPLVHSWPGANLLWPGECLWSTFDELKAIQPKDPVWCRKWVEERYSMEQCVSKFVELLEA